MFVSFAQNGEDVVLNRIFHDLDNGFYVDVGAMDPTQESVTKAFYDRGWSGINVEPNPEYYEKLVAERPRDVNVNSFAGDREGVVRFRVVPGTGLSTKEESLAAKAAQRNFTVVDQEVEMVPLRSILSEEKASDIHFLKIDVEGAERDVLLGMDFDKWRPWIVLVEAVAGAETVWEVEPSYSEWEWILLENGYQFSLFDGLNRWYVATEKEELRARCSFAACSLDNWIPLRYYQTETTLMKATAVLQQAQSALLSLQEECAKWRNIALAKQGNG